MDEEDPMTAMDAEATLAMHYGLNTCECNDMGEKDYSTSYAMYNFIVVIIILPFVAAFGIFSNFINCYIFTRPSLYSSVNIYLLALSCSDLLVVSTGVFVFYSDSVRVYFPSFTDVATQGIIWVLPLGFIAQTCSVYFTVAAAADCYVKVCWTPLSHHWCTPLRAKLVTLAITGFSIGYNALRFWQFQLNSCWDVLHNSSNIEVCPTDLYYEIGVIYNVYMYMVLMTVLPFMLLSFLNVLIVRTVQRIHRMNKKLMAALVIPASSVGKNGAVGHRLGEGLFDDKSPTSELDAPIGASPTTSGDDSVVTMVMVVILFLACNTLALIVNIVETFFDPDPLVVQYMTDTSNLLVVFNSSVNYVIYMCFDGVYRAEFKSCILCNRLCGGRLRAGGAPAQPLKRTGSSPILYSAEVSPQVMRLGEYLSVPTSPSAIQAPPLVTKSLSRFRSLDEDRDHFAMMPLMMSSDNLYQKGRRKSKSRNGKVEAIGASP